jgi:hypothetical protein
MLTVHLKTKRSKRALENCGAQKRKKTLLLRRTIFFWIFRRETSNWYSHAGPGYSDPDMVTIVGCQSRILTGSSAARGGPRSTMAISGACPTDRYRWRLPDVWSGRRRVFARATRTTYSANVRDRYVSKHAHARTHTMSMCLAAHDNATCVRATRVRGRHRRDDVLSARRQRWWWGTFDKKKKKKQCFNCYYRLPGVALRLHFRAHSTSANDAFCGTCGEGGKVTNPRPFADATL